MIKFIEALITNTERKLYAIKINQKIKNLISVYKFLKNLSFYSSSYVLLCLNLPVFYIFSFE